LSSTFLQPPFFFLRPEFSPRFLLCFPPLSFLPRFFFVHVFSGASFTLALHLSLKADQQLLLSYFSSSSPRKLLRIFHPRFLRSLLSLPRQPFSVPLGGSPFKIRSSSSLLLGFPRCVPPFLFLVPWLCFRDPLQTVSHGFPICFLQASFFFRSFFRHSTTSSFSPRSPTSSKAGYSHLRGQVGVIAPPGRFASGPLTDSPFPFSLA